MLSLVIYFDYLMFCVNKCSLNNSWWSLILSILTKSSCELHPSENNAQGNHVKCWLPLWLGLSIKQCYALCWVKPVKSLAFHRVESMLDQIKDNSCVCTLHTHSPHPNKKPTSIFYGIIYEIHLNRNLEMWKKKTENVVWIICK